MRRRCEVEEAPSRVPFLPAVHLTRFTLRPIQAVPELPEVEFAARRLRAAVLGHTLAAVDVFHPSAARHLPPAHRKALVGRQVRQVERRAKIQLLHLDDASVLEVHFRMTGDWAFAQVGDEAPRFERVRLDTREGLRVSLVDSRAFAVVRWHAPGKFVLPDLGPEPLGDDFTVDALRDALASRRAPIKPVLLDQRVVAGVGNIYASEALWLARISPETPASALTGPRQTARLTRLRDGIQEALRTAPATRYYNSGIHDGSPYDEPQDWRVYDREGQPCTRCGTRIVRFVQAGRSTYACGKCQR